MKSDRSPVAIVGGGFSGTMVAAQLARRGIDSVLIDGEGRAGNGVAFSTREPVHVLNVRAEGMSAWADDLDHFARLAEAEGVHRRDFVQRQWFGRYLRAILEETIESGRLQLVEHNALEARLNGSGWNLQLENGDEIRASALVLAIGNQPPEPLPSVSDSDRVIDNPWSRDAVAAIRNAARTDDDILLVGTGLSMVDAVLSLDSAGHRGRIVALSRRGLVPRAHSNAAPATIDADEVPHGHVRMLWRWLRKRGAELGWRSAVDALRPHSHAIWQSFPLDEQKRFVRHARPWWDVHRHRIAPDVAERLQALIGEGRLQIVSGRIQSATDAGDGLEVSYRRRGSPHSAVERFGYMINCTGPLGSISRTRNPMLRQMFADGLIRPDKLGIGLDVDERSRPAGSQRAWAMGPLTKGRYWEMTAVPDIRGQAAAVADDIAMELGR